MRNILLALNLVLLAAVGFLFYRSYNTSPVVNKGGYKNADSILPFQNRIAYFIIDSLESNFEYYKRKKSELEKIQKEGNDQLEASERNLSSRASQLSQQFQANPTPELKEKAEGEIGRLQEQLKNQKQTLDSKLFNYSKTMNDDVNKKIQDYLKEYNRSKGFAYILSDYPGLFYYKDSLLNITGELVNGLNQLYKN